MHMHPVMMGRSSALHGNLERALQIVMQGETVASRSTARNIWMNLHLGKLPT